MIPAAFEYERADSVDQAVTLLRDGGPDATLIAGGQSLLPLMKFRLARPSLLVDVSRLHELSYVRDAGDHIAIGALTRHHDVHHDATLQAGCGIVSEVAATVGDPQVRHRGTIGGSLAHGDPASDLPTVLLTLEADLVAHGADGERVIPAQQFFTGFFETALEPDEILTEVRVPRLDDNTGTSYEKFRRRAHDWAIVGVAAVVTRSNGAVGDARIGLTNMGATPLRASASEDALRGAGRDQLADATSSAADGTSPPSDTNGSAEYRQHLARVLTRRAVESALGG